MSKVFPHTTKGSWHHSNNDSSYGGVASGWLYLHADDVQGAAVASVSPSTVAGSTGSEVTDSANLWVWVTPPLSAGVTISGTVTLNIRMLESSMNANVGPRVVIERVDKTGAISTILDAIAPAEVGTSEAASNWTATATTTVMQKGDRLRIRILGAGVGGSMAAGFTYTLFYDGAAGASGDTYINFTQTLSFASVTGTPAGTAYYLHKEVESAVTVSDGKDKWRMKAVQDNESPAAKISADPASTNWTTGIPVQEMDGTNALIGNPIDFYTPRFEAFTLTGPILVNVDGAVFNTRAVSVQAEIAVTDNDGSNAVVFGNSWISPKDGAATLFGRLSAYLTGTSDHSIWVSGPDISVAQGQRIRLRLLVDDPSDQSVTGATAPGDIQILLAAAAGSDGDNFKLVLQDAPTEYDPTAHSGRAVAGTIGAGPSASVTQETAFGKAAPASAGVSASVAVEAGRALVGGAAFGVATKSSGVIYTDTGFGKIVPAAAGVSASIPVEAGLGRSGVLGSGESAFVDDSIKIKSGVGVIG